MNFRSRIDTFRYFPRFLSFGVDQPPHIARDAEFATRGRYARAMASNKMLDGSKLKVGDFMSRVSYMRVKSISGDNVVVENQDGFSWSISKTILEAEATSSTQYTDTKKVNRTELARIFELEVRDSVFSCSFTKLPNLSDQEALLANADLSTSAKRRKVAKDISKGDERTLHGFIVDTHEVRS